MTVSTTQTGTPSYGVLKRIIFGVQGLSGAFALRYGLIWAGMASPVTMRSYWAEPENLRLYLQTAGWERATAAPDGNRRPDVWVLPCTGGTYEVIVPSSRDTRDFDQRVAELLRTVAISENRRKRDVTHDLEELVFVCMFTVMDPELAAERAPLPQAGDTPEGAAEAEARRLELGRKWATATADYASELHQQLGAPYTGEWAEARRVLAKARTAIVPSLAGDDAWWLQGYTTTVNEELSAHDELQKQRTDDDAPTLVDDLERLVEFKASSADYFWKQVTDAAAADPPTNGTATPTAVV